MEHINAYRTQDGQLFETRAAAEAHEHFLKHAEEIESFLQSDLNPYSGPQRVVARNSIVSWNLWLTKRKETTSAQ